MSSSDDPYTWPCDSCGGDELPIVNRMEGRQGLGRVGLCEICNNSTVVSRWLAGGSPPEKVEHDVLYGNHVNLAASKRILWHLKHPTESGMGIDPQRDDLRD